MEVVGSDWTRPRSNGKRARAKGVSEEHARVRSGVSHARLSGSYWTSDLVESGGDTRDIGPLSSRHVEASHARGDVALLFMRKFPVFAIFLYFFFQNL